MIGVFFGLLYGTFYDFVLWKLCISLVLIDEYVAICSNIVAEVSNWEASDLVRSRRPYTPRYLIPFVQKFEMNLNKSETCDGTCQTKNGRSRPAGIVGFTWRRWRISLIAKRSKAAFPERVIANLYAGVFNQHVGSRSLTWFFSVQEYSLRRAKHMLISWFDL